MAQPLLSIIVPVYNVEQYLSSCINSILEQTFKDFELILIDDGSSDHSGEICDQYVQRDSRVYAVHKKNNGLSSARNEGLSKCRGRYIMFIDSDDVLGTKDTIERNILKIIHYREKTVLQFPTLWYWSPNRIQLLGSVNYLYSDKSAIYSAFFHRYITSTTWDKIYTRDIFENIRFPEGRYYEDTFCITDILQIVKVVILSNNGYYKYNIRQGSIIQSNMTPKKIEDYLVAISRLMELAIKTPNTELYRVHIFNEAIDRLFIGRSLLTQKMFIVCYQEILKFIPGIKAILLYMKKEDLTKGLKVLLIKVFGIGAYSLYRKMKTITI